MALLTDGNPNDIEALRVYETSILDVANVERSSSLAMTIRRSLYKSVFTSLGPKVPVNAHS